MSSGHLCNGGRAATPATAGCRNESETSDEQGPHGHSPHAAAKRFIHIEPLRTIGGSVELEYRPGIAKCCSRAMSYVGGRRREQIAYASSAKVFTRLTFPLCTCSILCIRSIESGLCALPKGHKKNPFRPIPNVNGERRRGVPCCASACLNDACDTLRRHERAAISFAFRRERYLLSGATTIADRHVSSQDGNSLIVRPRFAAPPLCPSAADCDKP